jgi:hypothetical protein
MSEYKDSPKPLRQSDPNPLFKEADDGYVVKGRTAIERQRDADGTGYSTNRPSSVEPKDYSLYVEADKVSKSKSISTDKEVDPDEVIKSYMSKASLPPNPALDKGCDEDDEDTEKGVIRVDGKKPSSLDVATGPAPKKTPSPKANNPKSGPYKPT